VARRSTPTRLKTPPLAVKATAKAYDANVLRPPRPLEFREIEALLASETPARLATLDADGFPHVTPLWFIWIDGAFFMTSISDRPHIERLSRDARAGLVIDVEDPERADGQRPNRQVRATGRARVCDDHDAAWTTRITRKYVHGPGANTQIQSRAQVPRTVIRLDPDSLVGYSSV